MNFAFRSSALLLLMSMEADGFVLQPYTSPPRSTQRQLQHAENESSAAAVDFPAEVNAEILKHSSIDDLSKLAAFIDSLATRMSASNESTLRSNWSSTTGHSDVSFGDANKEEDAVEGVKSDFIRVPESSSMDANTEASSAFDEVTGSTSEGLENMISDEVNMANGKDVSNSATVSLLSTELIVSIITLHAFVLTLQMFS